MSHECRITCVVPDTTSGGELIRVCEFLVKHANEELDRNAGSVRFKLNGVKVGSVPNEDPETIEESCDIGIAYGDSLSKWVNANISKKTFLLMSAADVKDMRPIHLKAYPSAATMGGHFSELVKRYVAQFGNNGFKLCALFESSEAGKVCRKAFEEASGTFVSQGDILTYKTDQCDFSEDVLTLLEKNYRVFCVYGFETSGQGYYKLLSSLVKHRKEHAKYAEIKILTDVNLPYDMIKNAGCANALVCGSTSDSERYSERYCVGVEFFEILMESLVELIIKTAMWRCRRADEKLCLKEEICKNYNCVTTRIGTFSFVNGALCVPFYYWFLDNADKLDKSESFRRECDSRDSVAVATTRIDELTDEISLKGLCDFEGGCKSIKSRFEMEILKPCFSALKIWFSDDNFSFIDDKLKFTKALSSINGNSIIQIPRDGNGVSSTDVLQLYWKDGTDVRNAFSIAEASRLKQLNGFELLVARDLQHPDTGKSCYKVFSAAESMKIVHEIAALELAPPETDPNACCYLYYVPYARTTISGAVKNVSSVVMSVSVKYRDMELAALKNLVERFFGAIYAVDNQIRINRESVKSAIGSIMSRNGSHNIGSHVLAALSHNVGTMPDDRVLYQYIQHRMDYIATATTDRPQWRQPTMFVSCLMKEFLKQKHLLEHISGSEGLHAYKFQSQTVACEQSDGAETIQQNTICIHIRRIIPDAVGNTDMDWEGKHFLNQHYGAVDFIGYDKSEMQNLLHDVALAIPGGVIGHHAFYTIIENILRNAAKHEWAESMRIWKVAVDTLGEETCKKEFGACLPRNLDLYIDFRDNPIEGKVECRIWNDKVVSVSETARIRTAVLKSLVLHSDKAECRGKLAVVAKLLLHWYRLVVNMPAVVDNALFKLIGQVARPHDKKQEYNADSKICDAIVESLTTKGRTLLSEGNVAIFDFIRTSIMCEDDQVKTELQNKIDLSFIDEDTGALRKENWGIAEMRISAGFLQCRETDHIGGLPGADSPLSIIRPIIVENQNHDKCVAYRFDVDKPKLLLVVLSSKHESEDVKTINENSARCGVTFIKYSDLKDGGAYPYSYTLFENLDEAGVERLASRKLMLPFRILCASAPKATKFRRFVPTFTGDFFTRWADNTLKLKESGNPAAEVCYSLFESVCADWLKHVQSHGLPRKKGRPEIVIDVGDGASSLGSAQTLISRFELLRFIFENTFNAAVRSFLKENGPEAGTGSVMPVKNDKEDCAEGGDERGTPEVISLPPKMAALLLAISQMESREIATDQKLADELGIGKRELLASATDIVQAQLRLWIRDEVLNANQSVRIEMDDPELKTIWGKALKTGEDVFVGTLSSLYDNDICRYWLARFVKYISTVILEQADSFLRKYEERFCTLPKMPLNEKRAVDDGKLPCSLQMANGFIQKIKLTNDPYDRGQALKNHDICYFRHGTDIQSAIMDNYYEPLSGAQSTFSAFMSLKQDLMEIESGFATTKKKDVHCRVAGFVTQLIENAAFRILIVDERVKKFMNAHSEVMDHLNGLRIAVADDTDPGVMQMFSSGFDDAIPEFSGVSLNDFEIVIIHQGIIDKLLLGHEDKLEVEKWMGRLIEKLHYVVITTGRGSPANIPDTARVLPYSIIESSILQRFPEKMILVDAVMNILPVRHQARKTND